jgi:O-antigen/teichoic acid export membrane protein
VSDAAAHAPAPTAPAGELGERRLLRWVAEQHAVPAPLRRAVSRLAGSDVGYRLAHGAFWSIAGVALSRALALGASVVTARILGRHAYGELGVLSSTVLTFQAFSSLGLGMTSTKYVAELRDQDPARAGRILALSTVASTVAGALAAAAMWGLAPWLAARTLDAPQLAGGLRIAAVALFFTTIAAAHAGALAGLEAFRAGTWVAVASGVAGVPLAVVGVWRWGLDGAVWAMAATAAVQWALTRGAVRSQARRRGVPLALRGWTRESAVLWTFALPALVQGLMVAPVNWAASAVLVRSPGGLPEMGALTASGQWYAAALFVPTALGSALLPVLSERVGRRDAAGARAALRAAILTNVAVVAPIVAAGALVSPRIMGMYGEGFRAAWPTLAVALGTAGVVAVTNPVGSVLAASGRLWLGFAMNAGWAAVFLAGTAALVRFGALGVASARLVAYGVHAGWTFWFAARYLRARGAAR